MFLKRFLTGLNYLVLPLILVDTSVWIDHLRVGDIVLAQLLESSQVLAAASLSDGARIWTRDKSLLAQVDK